MNWASYLAPYLGQVDQTTCITRTDINGDHGTDVADVMLALAPRAQVVLANWQTVDDFAVAVSPPVPEGPTTTETTGDPGPTFSTRRVPGIRDARLGAVDPTSGGFEG